VRVIRAALPTAAIALCAHRQHRVDGGPRRDKYGSPYTAAKHGVIGLTRSLAVEFGREGITVNCIAPGPIRTSMTAAIPDAQKTAFAKRRTALAAMPSRGSRPCHAELLSAGRSYITGTVLPVDGGC